MAQCAPELALPEPAAISGGSKRKSIGAETWKSQTIRISKQVQKTAALMFLEPIAFSNSNPNQRPNKGDKKPKPAVKTSS